MSEKLKLYNENSINEIAKAINTKLNVEKQYKVSEMAEAILTIPTEPVSEVFNTDLRLNLEVEAGIHTFTALLHVVKENVFMGYLQGFIISFYNEKNENIGNVRTDSSGKAELTINVLETDYDYIYAQFEGTSTFKSAVSNKATSHLYLRFGGTSFYVSDPFEAVDNTFDGLVIDGVNKDYTGGEINLTGLSSSIHELIIKAHKEYKINKEAFIHTMRITSVFFSNYITDIKERSFEMNVELNSIIIPSNIKNIESSCFNKCKVHKIVFESIEPPANINNEAFNGVADDCEIYVPRNSIHYYKEAMPLITIPIKEY